jgi:peptide/nickel transport system substrate-binding protein
MWTDLDRRGFLQAAGLLGGTLAVGDMPTLLAAASTRTSTLRVAVDRDFESLRPDIGAGDTNHTLKRLIYVSPILWGTRQRADGTLIYDPSTIELRLATSYHVSADRRTIEFTLHKHAKFANGDPIDATVVKASYAWCMANGGSGGAQLRVNGLPSPDRIEVVSDHLLRLHLDRPVAWGLIGNALLSGASIVHAEEIRTHATADDPHGINWLETNTVESGPYVVDSWKKGSAMVLRANPHFFDPPQIQRILLQIIPDASTRRILLEKGDVDLAIEIAAKDIADLGRKRGVKVLSYPSTQGWWLGLSWRKEPFNDSHVRRAVACGPCRMI